MLRYPSDANNWPMYTVYGCDFREDLLNMANAITILELWDWMKNNEPPEDKGYAWWGHSNINKIDQTIVKNGHSGATFAHALRIMQYIANNGFDAWQEKLKNEYKKKD